MPPRKKLNTAPVRNFATPKAAVVWANVDVPDTKFNDEGVFQARVALEEDDATQIQKRLDALLDELSEEIQADLTPAKFKKLTVASPLQPEEDEDGNETGRFLFSAKGKKQPAVFDSRGTRLDPPPKVGRGSILQLGVTLAPWVSEGLKKYGVTAYLNAVRIVTLNEAGGGNFDWDDDDEDEGGYVASAPVAASPFAADGDDDAEGGDF